MPRAKATPVRNEDATVNDAAPLVALRLRTPSGVVSLDGLTARSTLQQLREACEAALGAPLASLSFRADDAGVVSLVLGGNWPALGALLVGPASRLGDVGVANGIMLMASPTVANPKPNKSLNKLPNKRPADKPVGPTTAKKSAILASSSSSSISSTSSSSSAVAAATTVAAATAAADPTAAASDALAQRFVHAASDSGGDSVAGTGLATHFQSAAAAAKRLAAASKGLVAVVDVGGPSGKHLDVSFRATGGGAASDERVAKLSAEVCSDVCARILFRSAGSRRRRATTLAAHGGSGPSTKLLTPDAIAARLPDLFWSLYDNSRSGRSEVGNVQFALDHVVAAAVAKFQALVEAEETPKE